MKRHTLTPEERLWRQVWRVWPEAMQYEQVETPFDAPQRVSSTGISLGRAWLQNKQHREQRGRS
jgi:hypothetical protein